MAHELLISLSGLVNLSFNILKRLKIKFSSSALVFQHFLLLTAGFLICGALCFVFYSPNKQIENQPCALINFKTNLEINL